ncbi:MAG: hypothetical protein ABJZ69_07505 [Hyphomicrobiales bacterium]
MGYTHKQVSILKKDEGWVHDCQVTGHIVIKVAVRPVAVLEKNIETTIGKLGPERLLRTDVILLKQVTND